MSERAYKVGDEVEVFATTGPHKKMYVGKRGIIVEIDDYCFPYELKFHDAELQAQQKREGYWLWDDTEIRRPAPAETREVVATYHNCDKNGEAGIFADCDWLEWDGEKMWQRWADGRRVFSENTTKFAGAESMVKNGWWIKKEVRYMPSPAPAPEKASTSTPCDKPVTAGATPCDKPLPRQPHEPETVAMMRPEELRQFRAAQAKKEKAEQDRRTYELTIQAMAFLEKEQDKLTAEAIKGYRNLCCEKGGGE